MVDDVSTTPVIYWVHFDQLSRPIRMTDGGKASVWDAVWAPWGAPHLITGATALDARFPGQWFQLESGLHYKIETEVENMSDENVPTFSELYARLWGKLMLERKYSDAASIALNAYFLGWEADDEDLKIGGLELLHKSIEEVSGKPTANGPKKPSCFFCGRGSNQVELAGGAGGFICAECTQTFHKAFSSTRPKND